MKKTHYYAKYTDADGRWHCVNVFRFRKSMIGKPLWVNPQYGESCTELIIAETSNDYTNRGWYKVKAVIKEQKIVRMTRVY